MKNQKKCPACGTMLPEDASKCTVCKLDGLNLRFLSKAGYEKWVKEVLNPHIATRLSPMAARLPKVIAGEGYGLILTPQGKLYGIGDNHLWQIADTDQEKYEQPVLIAQNVISAATGDGTSFYVTWDGKLHGSCFGSWTLRAYNNGGFSRVKEVYCDHISDHCYIVDENDQIWLFDSLGEKPVLCPEREWMRHTPHRTGSEPITAEELFREEWFQEDFPNVRKIVNGGLLADKEYHVLLLENGRVVVLKETDKGEDFITMVSLKLDWLKERVTDIGTCRDFSIFVCANGDILWCDGEDMLDKVIDGKMNVCRLPEDA